MARVTVRDLDDDFVVRLKNRARANKRSMEGEVRAILEAAIDRPAGPAARFDWDAYLRRAREIVGEKGTPATAMADIRAWRDGKR